MLGLVGIRFVLRTTPSHVSIPPNQNVTFGQKRINETGRCNRENTAFWTVLRTGVRVQLNRIRLWPPDKRSRVLIGAGGRRRSGWSARVLANDLSTRIDRQAAREERSIAHSQGQVAASCYSLFMRKGQPLSTLFYFRLSKLQYCMMHHGPLFLTKLPGLSKQVAALKSQPGLENRRRFSQHNHNNLHHDVCS